MKTIFLLVNDHVREKVGDQLGAGVERRLWLHVMVRVRARVDQSVWTQVSWPVHDNLRDLTIP
jgi:hypothetical protein